MAKSANQKLKLLYLQKIFLEKTDENHPMTIAEIISELSTYGISAERKSIYDDIEALEIFDLEIVRVKSKSTAYYCSGGILKFPELKLLVNVVQSAKFITHRKSTELIKKLESLTSKYQAKELAHQIYVANRIKTINESIYYNVDIIHSAIINNKKIVFKYFEYNINKERVYKHNDAAYIISPLSLTWDDENYFMIGYDNTVNMLEHYRVDKMDSISILEDNRLGLEEYEQTDMALYAKKIFSMFGGVEENVTLSFTNKLIGVVIDCFGKDVIIFKEDEEHFKVNVSLVVTPQFYGLLARFGNEVKITSPQRVKDSYLAHIKEIVQC